MDMHEPGCAGGELLHYLQRQGDSLRTEIFEAAPLCCAEHLRDVDLTVPRVDTKLKLKPSKADMKTLRPLLRAHEEAMASLEDEFDVERLDSTFAALMKMVQEMAGIRAHRVELTPETLGGNLTQVPIDLFRLHREVRELRVESTQLATLPAWMGNFVFLEHLDIDGGCRDGYDSNNYVLKKLDASIGKLVNLKTLNLHGLDELETLPESLGNLSGNLKHLNISHCGKFEMFMQRVPRFFTLPASSGSLVGLKSLQILKCSSMKELPTSIARLVGLEKLVILGCGLKEMPSIETLTALRWLQLEVSGVAFKTLSRSLPCLQQLRTLGVKTPAELREEDLLNMGRALKAWPQPLLLNFQLRQNGWRGDDVRLSRCSQALGLPAEAADWDNKTTLHFLRLQQQKVTAFASGLHQRLGAASAVSCLNQPTLVMIVDAVLGGWSLLEQWQRERTGEEEGAGTSPHMPST